MWAMIEFMIELANRSPHLCDLLTGAIMFPGREFWFEERAQQNYKEGVKKRMRKKTKKTIREGSLISVQLLGGFTVTMIKSWICILLLHRMALLISLSLHHNLQIEWS